MDTPTDRSHRSYHRLPVDLRARCRVVLAAVCVTACGVSTGSAASAQVRTVRRPIVVVGGASSAVAGLVATSSTTSTTTTSTTTTAVVPLPGAAAVIFDPKDPRCRVKLATRALLDRQMAKASTQLARADSRLRRAQAVGQSDLLAALTAEFNDAKARVSAVQADIDTLVLRCH